MNGRRETAGKKKRKQGTGEGRQGEILDAAIRLFAARGIAGTSTKDIADAVGLTKSMVHYYFANKAHLVVEAQERVYRRDLDRVRARIAAAGTNPRRRAIDALRDLWDAVHSDPETRKVRIELWSEAQRDRSMRNRAIESHRAARELVVEGVREALGPEGAATIPMPLEAIAELVIAVINGLTVYEDPAGPSPAAVFEVFIGSLVEAVKQLGERRG